MAGIEDLQHLFLHYDVIESLCKNLANIQALVSTTPEHNEPIQESQRHLLLTIKQLEEQQ